MRSVASRLGHARSGQELPRLLRDARRVREQVELAHELPSAGAELPADARVAAPLRLGLAVDVRLHRRAALADALVDPVALGRGEPLRRVPHVVAGERDVGSVLFHGVRGADEQVALLCQRHGEWVDLDRVLPMVGARLDRGQLEIGSGDRCAGACDRRRLRSSLPCGLYAEVGGREEAPARADEGSHPDPDGPFLGEPLDLPVPGVHGLVAPVHDPRVGVSGAGPHRGLYGRIGVVEHGQRLAPLTDFVAVAQSVRPGPAGIPPPARWAASSRSTGSCQVTWVMREAGHSPSGGTMSSSASSGIPIGATR